LKTVYRKKFLKELSRIPSKTRIKIEQAVFSEIPKLEKIGSAKNIEKLKGYSSYYKIRFGDYRVGLKLENDEIVFETVLHRKEIYKYFPS